MGKYIGKNIKDLIQTDSDPYCFRINKKHVYYVRQSLASRAKSIPNSKIISLGQDIGKFTHHGKFRLSIGSLGIIEKKSTNMVWIKPKMELNFLQGNHIKKSQIIRISERIPTFKGVLILSISNIPLGYGIITKTTEEARKSDPSSIIVLHMADIGEYLKEQSTADYIQMNKKST